jgi:hypothetical protein
MVPEWNDSIAVGRVASDSQLAGRSLAGNHADTLV